MRTNCRRRVLRRLRDRVRHEGAAPPLPETLDARQQARRSGIVEAAVRLMKARDHESVQMKDVTVEAGVALGTVYRYFGSKEHLFAVALLAWSEGYRSEVGEPLAGPSVDRLKLAYRRAVRAFERHPTIYGHMLAVQGSTDPFAVEIFRRFARRQQEAFASFLPRVPAGRRAAIVDVMDAVLDTNLREWTLGRKSIDDVYAAIDSAAELVLG